MEQVDVEVAIGAACGTHSEAGFALKMNAVRFSHAISRSYIGYLDW